MYRVLLLSFAFLFTGIITAQVTISIPEVTVEAQGASVTVPVNVINFTGIGAITLKINFNPDVLSFQGTPNPLPGTFVINSANGSVMIGWISTTPLNIGTGKLLDLNFTHIAGNCDLNFSKEECEIANVSAVPVNVTYQDGKILDSQIPLQKASIGDRVFVDSNKNGIQDNGETGLQWVTVDLYDCNDEWKAWTLTDAEGKFSFKDIEPGNYYLKFYFIDDNSVYTFSPKDEGDNDTLDSDIERFDDSTAITGCVALSSGENDLSLDAGVYKLSTDVSEVSALLPDDFSLSQNYPNPFNPTTEINFDIAKKELVSLKVYDTLGQEVAELVNNELDAGRYSVTFNASDMASGVYFYHLYGRSVHMTRKMILTK